MTSRRCIAYDRPLAAVPLPLQPDEYEKLGSYALCGLPDDLYPTRFVEVRRRRACGWALGCAWVRHQVAHGLP